MRVKSVSQSGEEEGAESTTGADTTIRQCDALGYVIVRTASAQPNQSYREGPSEPLPFAVECSWRGRFRVGLFVFWLLWTSGMLVGSAGALLGTSKAPGPALAFSCCATLIGLFFLVQQLRWLLGRTVIRVAGDELEVINTWWRLRNTRSFSLSAVVGVDVRRKQIGVLYGTPLYSWGVAVARVHSAVLVAENLSSRGEAEFVARQLERFLRPREELLIIADGRGPDRLSAP